MDAKPVSNLFQPQELQDPRAEMKRLWIFLAATALLGAAFFACLLFLRWLIPWTFRNGTEPWYLEAWAGSLGLAYLVSTAFFFSRFRAKQLVLPVVCVALVGLLWLSVVRQSYATTYDFECYYQAGKAVRHHINIYAFSALDQHRYLYSPLTATLFSAAELLPEFEQKDLSYFIWSIANYWALMAFFLLLVSALRLYGVNNPYLWPFAAAVMMCNVPLQRTIIYSQVNLLVINCLLGFLLLYRRRPGLSGGLLAGAVVLKTTPLLLLLPVLLERRWRALIGFLIGALLLIGGSVAIVGTRPWIDFLHTARAVQSHGEYRDNSLQSLLQSLSLFGGIPADQSLLLTTGTILAAAAGIVFIILALRPNYRALFRRSDSARFMEGALPFFLCAMLIVSPLVWEHHWIFLQLPFLLLIARAWGTRFLRPALLAYGLVFLVPTFDIFPLSYHRLAGLVWWAFLVRKLVHAEMSHLEANTAAISQAATPRSPIRKVN